MDASRGVSNKVHFFKNTVPSYIVLAFTIVFLSSNIGGDVVLVQNSSQINNTSATNFVQTENDVTTEDSVTVRDVPITNGTTVGVSDVIFLLYADPSNPNNSREIIFQSKLSLDESKYIPNKQLKILIHGFMQNASTNFPTTLKNAYLSLLQEKPHREKFNLILIDWGKLTPANTQLLVNLYNTAVKSIYTVGQHVANFLIYLHDLNLLKSYADVHLIGFSLGAQLAGITGQFVQLNSTEKIGRITALDPAGPLFYNTEDDKKLDASDADFVDVIHTNAGFLGYAQSLGHVDVFPNGGRMQPGCEKDWTGVCSHTRSHKLYTRSISDENALIGCKCESWSKFESCKVDCVDHIRAGEPLPNTARGIYYMRI